MNKKNKILIISIVLIVLIIGIFMYFKLINNNTKNNIEKKEEILFKMTIEDVFISTTGTVVTGEIEKGTIKTGDTVQIIGEENEITVTEIESSRKIVKTAREGDTVGLNLQSNEKIDIKRGQILIKQNNNEDNNQLNNTNNEKEDIKNEIKDTSNSNETERPERIRGIYVNEKTEDKLFLNYNKNGKFLMTIRSISNGQNGEIIIGGEIEKGIIQKNDSIQIIGLNKDIKTTKVIGITVNKKTVNTASAEDYAEITVQNIKENDIEIGQVLAEPNSIESKSKFEAEVYLLRKDEGGGFKSTVSNNYITKFEIRETYIMGKINFPNDIKSLTLGENINITIELEKPVAIEEGTLFNLRDKEDNRTVGIGKITKVY